MAQKELLYTGVIFDDPRDIRKAHIFGGDAQRVRYTADRALQITARGQGDINGPAGHMLRHEGKIGFG